MTKTRAQRPHRGRVRALAAVFFATAIALSPGSASADEATDKAFHEGEDALTAGNFQLAYERFLSLYEKHRSLDVAANLSLAESKLGKTRDAAEHLAFALSVIPATEDPALRTRMEADLAALEKGIGRIDLDCPAGTTITVGSRVVGVTPILPIYVDPGDVVITGQREPEGKTTQTVTVGRGERTVVKLAWSEKPVETAGPPIWSIGLLGGLAAAGLVVGVAGFVVSAGHGADGDDALVALRDASAGCGPGGSRCASIQSEFDQQRDFQIMGVVGATAGAAALVGMVIDIVLVATAPSEPRSSDATPGPGREQPRWAVAPIFTPDYSGVVLRVGL